MFCMHFSCQDDKLVLNLTILFTKSGANGAALALREQKFFSVIKIN